ncbi:hypothetical protein HW555_007392 [Spodoptera exigua]|uniref:Uncharacterized protein n=1 Tax=Spodoptera exigua TaxID=7107 RepID=A0A835GH77_SPOEX|nr:hypothetical protein HW555_007392 [Spodoptera exigua]
MVDIYTMIQRIKTDERHLKCDPTNHGSVLDPSISDYTESSVNLYNVQCAREQPGLARDRKRL